VLEVSLRLLLAVDVSPLFCFLLSLGGCVRLALPGG